MLSQDSLSRRLGPVFAEMSAQVEQAAQDDALLAELAKPIVNPAMPPCHCGLRAEVQWRAGAQCSEHNTFNAAAYKPTPGGYPWAG